MDALVVTTANRIGRAWLTAVAHLREQNTAESIALRLYTSDPLAGVHDAAGYFAAQEHAAYVSAGQATARWLDAQVTKHHTGAVPVEPTHLVAKKLGGFDIAEPPAVAWAQQNQLDKIREIDADTRELIRGILIDAARTGENPLVVAREIRESIGLTAHQASVVESYRRSLESGQYAAALGRELSSGVSDKTIAAALRNETLLTKAQIETAVTRYRDNMLALRAETIARTEGLRVAHQGSEELYRQAVARGDLEAEQIERTWHHSPRRTAARRAGRAGRGGRSGPRQFHVVMDGQTRGFGELFESGIGGRLRYPGDPEAGAEETLNCACALSTRILPSARAGAQSPGGGDAAEEEVVDPAALEEEAAAAAAAVTEEEAAAAAEEEQALADEATADAEEEQALAVPTEEEAQADAAMAEFDELDAEQQRAAHARAQLDLAATRREVERLRGTRGGGA